MMIHYDVVVPEDALQSVVSFLARGDFAAGQRDLSGDELDGLVIRIGEFQVPTSDSEPYS